jgi:hypothetical protein
MFFIFTVIFCLLASTQLHSFFLTDVNLKQLPYVSDGRSGRGRPMHLYAEADLLQMSISKFGQEAFAQKLERQLLRQGLRATAAAEEGSRCDSPQPPPAKRPRFQDRLHLADVKVLGKTPAQAVQRLEQLRSAARVFADDAGEDSSSSEQHQHQQQHSSAVIKQERSHSISREDDAGAYSSDGGGTDGDAPCDEEQQEAKAKKQRKASRGSSSSLRSRCSAQDFEDLQLDGPSTSQQQQQHAMPVMAVGAHQQQQHHSYAAAMAYGDYSYGGSQCPAPAISASHFGNGLHHPAAVPAAAIMGAAGVYAQQQHNNMGPPLPIGMTIAHQHTHTAHWAPHQQQQQQQQGLASNSGGGAMPYYTDYTDSCDAGAMHYGAAQGGGYCPPLYSPYDVSAHSMYYAMAPRQAGTYMTQGAWGLPHASVQWGSAGMQHSMQHGMQMQHMDSMHQQHQQHQQQQPYHMMQVQQQQQQQQHDFAQLHMYLQQQELAASAAAAAGRAGQHCGNSSSCGGGTSGSASTASSHCSNGGATTNDEGEICSQRSLSCSSTHSSCDTVSSNSSTTTCATDRSSPVTAAVASTAAAAAGVCAESGNFSASANSLLTLATPRVFDRDSAANSSDERSATPITAALNAASNNDEHLQHQHQHQQCDASDSDGAAQDIAAAAATAACEEQQLHCNNSDALAAAVAAVAVNTDCRFG